MREREEGASEQLERELVVEREDVQKLRKQASTERDLRRRSEVQASASQLMPNHAWPPFLALQSIMAVCPAGPGVGDVVVEPLGTATTIPTISIQSFTSWAEGEPKLEGAG